MNKNLVIMFVKEPKLGFVKTRLSKDCDEEFTLDLYKCFVRDLISTLKVSEFDFKLCAYPKLDLINKEFGDFNNFLQSHGDLGVKMQNAFQTQFENGYEKIVLIGSDTPHISNEIINESFLKLDTNDIVLGPSLDGGYYLIAFSKQKFYDEVFKNISWSTENVLEETLQKLHEKQVNLLHSLNDIDVLDDLNSFFKEYSNSFFKTSETIKFLEKRKSWRSLM
ncbi:TIGR04282 family arsenosugar biosynthesis glycosyltransferase [Arcobacter sp. LA11]|uniref:TIGR04282 family arsenosugar biosynthesis glycosyltransferase n=1 Tax=Arcobacter sp. LA11 TaxID=1898176 RepID=UPI0009355DE8|nr:TIGR04282 family arsenosugar biosynthesis glycosyltransferase [Arcobacter sp. LA11]